MTMKAMRTCIGSERFGIVAHDAPIADFPKQPSQKDGLGRMCRTHWKEYVSGLGRDAKARAANGTASAAEPTVQSQATARVATKRAARVAAAKPAPEKVAKVRKAKALVDAIDALPGPEHVAAIATDEAQEALEVVATNGGAIDEAEAVREEAILA